MAERTDAFACWASGERLAQIDDVHVARLDKPGPIWAAIRAQGTPPPSLAPGPVPFTVSLTVGAPSEVNRSAAGIVKPLLDGVISAFHAHDHASNEDLLARLSLASDLSVEHARQALLDPHWAALGSRKLVKPFSLQGVQWNPAEEHCVAAEVLLDASPTTDGTWRVSGQLSRATYRT